MSTGEPEPIPTESTEVDLAYAAASGVTATASGAEVTLFGNLRRPGVKLDAQLKQPLRVREALSALYAIVGSDYRYTPKDRTAYMAYLRMKRESAGLNVWQAQQAYFSWLLRNDPLAFLILDPIITVHPDRVLFEVFSKDEGTYASLALHRSALEVSAEPTCGTTNIDFSEALFGGIQLLRSYRTTRLKVGHETVSVGTTGTSDVLEKKIRVPDSWLRGFLQVQSAATLPMESFALAPLDLYNVLRHLRLNGDRKGQRRGLRIELIPGQAPRMVLEPWDVVQHGGAGICKGKTPRVVRVWGRRRLLLLRRLLPYIESIEVHVLGSGLPTFWVFRGSDMTLTLGLTGFTSSNWSQAISFDLLLPRQTQSSEPLEKVLAHLAKVWFADTAALTKATGLEGAALREALQLGCQQGKLMYDLAARVYRLRPLIDGPLDLTRLEYRNARERTAYDLLARRGGIRILTEQRLPGAGLEVTAQVNVSEDKREYRPQILLADEGHVSKAECTCTLFRKQGLKAGPCAHLIALRLAVAEREKKREQEAEPRQAVTIETRSYTRRDEAGEETLQLALHQHTLKTRWGRAGQPARVQTLRYNSVEDARAAYFGRIAQLDERGYLDATAG